MRSSSGVLRTRLSEGYKTGPIATCLAVALVYAVFFLCAGVAAEVVSAKKIEALTAKARDLYAAGKYREAVNSHIVDRNVDVAEFFRDQLIELIHHDHMHELVLDIVHGLLHGLGHDDRD